MKFLFGVVFVFACVFGGYAAPGGHLDVLWQPFEFVIILGAAIGAFIIGNPPKVIKSLGSMFGTIFSGSKYDKDDYVALLSLQFTLFKLAKSKGSLALEAHVESPEESNIFSQFPSFMKDHHAVEFMCDYIRLITLGTENPHEVGDLMDEELETHHQEQEMLVGAVQSIADGTPALGIVAAVLGVIHTMGAIDQPPEILGHLIGAALVGTFFGVFVSYGFFAPMAMSLKASYESESKYYLSIKAGLIAHLQGYAPAVSVEFARKALMSDVRPTFIEVEEAVQDITVPA